MEEVSRRTTRGAVLRRRGARRNARGGFAALLAVAALTLAAAADANVVVERPVLSAPAVTSVGATTATGAAAVSGGGPAERGFLLTESVPAVGVAAGGELGSPALSPERVQRELDDYLALGVGHVRADAPWAQIEPAPGVYDWSWPDRWIPYAHELGLDVIVTLAYSPRWVTGAEAGDKVGPKSAEERDAYAAAAAELVRRYPYVRALEIWNEPNHAGFWAAPDPGGYADLLRRAYVAVKAAAPGVEVLGGALAEPPFGEGIAPTAFLEGMYAAGAHGSFDALSVHPYVGNGESIPWETPAATGSWFGPAPSVLATLHANEPGKRVWSTETGDTALATTAPATVGRILDTLRGYQTAGWGGPISWYAWRSLDAYSLTDESLGPRPAYLAFRQHVAAAFAAEADLDFPAATCGIGEFWAPLTGLEPGRTYWARAYARDRHGTVYGGVRRFTTATP